jgi:hypothetical protein
MTVGDCAEVEVMVKKSILYIREKMFCIKICGKERRHPAATHYLRLADC